jgi:hypothetical protein
MSLVVYKEEQESLVAPFVAPIFSIFGFIMLLIGSIPMLLGFTAGGIAAGSAAAAVQAAIGNVAAGSGFAAMQSLGATGVFNMLAGLGGAAAGAGLCALSDGKDDLTADNDSTNERVDANLVVYTEEQEPLVTLFVASLFSILSSVMFLFGSILAMLFGF